MGLRLHTVPAKRGAHWIKQAFVTWWRRPLGFIGLFMFLLFGAMLLMTIPVVGGLLGLGLLPLLTLGFMIATRSALQGGPVHAMQAFEGLRGTDPRRRNAQLLLCALYALASIGVIEFAEWIDEGLFMQLQRAMATTGSTAADINRLLTDPRLASGMLARFGLAGVLSVPFWHAPALVHWGGQSVFQALFSSSLALWRARAAFVVYALTWMALAMLLGLLITLLASLLGSLRLLSLLVTPLGLILSTVFYVSLWFSFADSFGDDVAPLVTPLVTPPG